MEQVNDKIELLKHELGCYKKLITNLYYWLKSSELERIWDKDELEYEDDIIDEIKALKKIKRKSV